MSKTSMRSMMRPWLCFHVCNSILPNDLDVEFWVALVNRLVLTFCAWREQWQQMDKIVSDDKNICFAVVKLASISYSKIIHTIAMQFQLYVGWHVHYYNYLIFLACNVMWLFAIGDSTVPSVLHTTWCATNINPWHEIS